MSKFCVRWGILIRGWFGGGGGGQGGGGRHWGRFLYSRNSTKIVPLCTISTYPFLVTDPKNFLKALFLVKAQFFWSKFSKNCLKAPFLACFFKILPATQKLYPKQVLCVVLWESSENKFGRPIFGWLSLKFPVGRVSWGCCSYSWGWIIQEFFWASLMVSFHGKMWKDVLSSRLVSGFMFRFV